MSQFFTARLEMGIAPEIAQIVDHQFAKVEG